MSLQDVEALPITQDSNAKEVVTYLKTAGILQERDTHMCMHTCAPSHTTFTEEVRESQPPLAVFIVSDKTVPSMKGMHRATQPD